MNKRGIVYRSVGGLFTVKTEEGVFDCSLRRAIKDNIYVGDEVMIDCGHRTIEELFPRRHLLYRPPVANADHVLIVCSAKEPTPSFLLMDRMLVAAEEKHLTPILCVNKIDLGDIDLSRYEKSGYLCLKVSAVTGSGADELRRVLKDRITVLSGPSGVGKSSLTAFLTGRDVRISHVSKAANRGRHTTRHSEFFELPFGGLLVDSPGFGAMDLRHIGREELRHYFPEFGTLPPCRFSDCIHVNEPECEVLKAVREGDLSISRYQSYLKILEEM